MKLLLHAAALGLAVAGLSGCVTFTDSGGGSRALQSESPSALGTAIFTKEIGPQDSAVNFQVIDPKVGAAPVTVDFVGDANWKGEPPKNAVWSADGSVIAVQGADFQSWSHAYDFKKHDFSVSALYPLPHRAKTIEKLLKSRGGIGPKVTPDWTKFDQVARPIAKKRR